MEHKDQDEVSRVSAALMAAFLQGEASEYEPQDQDKANSMIIKDTSELRAMLLSFDSESLPGVLSEVLVDLLGSIDRSDIDLVVDALNVPTSKSEASFAQDKQFLGDAVAYVLQKNNSELRKAKRQSFEGFNPQQATAILNWLLLVRSWPELQRYSETVDEAIYYWQGKSF